MFELYRIPISVVFLADFEDQLPISAHVFTNLPAHLNSALNPIFYAIFNPKMKQGYVRFIHLMICRADNKVNKFELSARSSPTITNKPVNALNNISASENIEPSKI